MPMRFRFTSTLVAGGLVYGLARVMVTLNLERATEASGSDMILVHVWTTVSQFLDILFDDAGAWIVWLSLGAIIGGRLYNYGRGLEDGIRGRQGGPPFWYLKVQARLVRFGIKHPWYQRIGDLAASLENVSKVLVDIYGFPALPASSVYAADEDLLLTGEYLRRVIPHLSSAHINEAKAAANRFHRQARREKLASLTN